MPYHLEPGDEPMQVNRPFRQFRGSRGHRRRGGGFLADWFQDEAKRGILISVGGLVLVFGFLAWWFWPEQAEAQAPAPVPTATEQAAVVLPQVVQEATPTPRPLVEAPATVEIMQFEIEPDNGQPWVTMFGVVDFDPDCPLTNFGFDATGRRYYLSVLPGTDLPPGNPQGQMAMVRGYTQTVETCDADLLHVDYVQWLNVAGTPAAPNGGEVITQTSRSEGRGVGAQVFAIGSAATPNATAQYLNSTQAASNTRHLYVTSTITPTTAPVVQVVAPTATPYIRPPTIYPTHTPRPTYTPYPSPTANPTAAFANLLGSFHLSSGCYLSNISLDTGQVGGDFTVIIPANIQLDYERVNRGDLAQVSGFFEDGVCGRVLQVQNVVWMSNPTATPTASATATASATFTPSATPTATNSPEPGATETPTATATATASPLPPTNTPEPTATPLPPTPTPTTTGTGLLPEPTPVPLP